MYNFLFVFFVFEMGFVLLIVDLMVGGMFDVEEWCVVFDWVGFFWFSYFSLFLWLFRVFFFFMNGWFLLCNSNYSDGDENVDVGSSCCIFGWWVLLLLFLFGVLLMYRY